MENSLWTETPAEKMQRLKDEAAGIKRKKPGNDDESVDRERKRIRDEEIRKEVEKHNVRLTPPLSHPPSSPILMSMQR